jgi:hypothetical protein
MSYEKLKPGDAMYEYVRSNRAARPDEAALFCDAINHNDQCDNPECWKYKPNVGRSEYTKLG